MSEWIETGTGNRISRSATIAGANRISISDNCTICENASLNGDVATASDEPAIVLGKYTFLDQNTVIDPPIAKKRKSAETSSPSSRGSGKIELCAPVNVGNYTTIGTGSKVRSVQVGNRVQIGRDCMLGEHSVINDCCVIEDGTVIPPKAVIPPYSCVSGVPGKSYFVKELNPAYRKLLETNARLRHALG